MRYGITRTAKVQANILSLVLFQLDTKKPNYNCGLYCP